MTPIWRALFVSKPQQSAHLWERNPHSSYPDALHSLCGKVKVISPLALEQDNPDRHHCLSCGREEKNSNG